MTLRKNISLSEEYLHKLEPLLEKHKGNLSATIREVIELADAALQDPDSVKRLISGLKKEQNLTSAALTWSLKNLSGRLPDEEIVDNILGKDIISVSSLKKFINELGGEIYWETSVEIESDDDIRPIKALITITGKNHDMNRFIAGIIAVFAMKQFNLGVLKIYGNNNSLNMEMVRGTREWISKNLTENLGYMDNAVSVMYSKPDFWNVLTKLYSKMDYNMVAISKHFFDGLLSGGKLPKMTSCFERYYGAHIGSISHENFIKKLYPLYSSMGLIEMIDVDDKSIIIHHGLSESMGIKKLADIFVELLALNGQKFLPEVNENLIILKHVPDERKNSRTQGGINKINDSPADFDTDVLESLPVLIPFDEDIIKSLGFDFGKRMIQSYEKEKMIEKWDTKSFIEFLNYMVALHKLDINWETVNGDLISGRIITCPAKDKTGKADITRCTFIKGMFNGCIVFAFGELPGVIHESHTGEPGDENAGCKISISLVNEN
jgi:hypothetical protein